MQLLVDLNKEGKTIIMVTHEPEIAAFAHRRIVIRDGVISSDSKLERGDLMQNWKFAISSIMSHKLRSFLTMVGIIIGVASVVVIMALGDGMKAGVTKTFTKDQEYVQISYSPNKSGYVTGINIGPSEDTGEGGGESGPAAEDRGMAAPSDIDGENAEDVDGQVQEAPPVVQESWVKELTKIQGIDGYYVSNTSNATIAFQKKKADGVNIQGGK